MAVPFFNRIRKALITNDRGILDGFIDYHSHILPGVDDGVRTLDDSLRILREYDRLGVAEVWITPHVMEDYPNSTERLKERFSELKETYDGSVKLNLASENMLDGLFMERLENDDILPLKDRVLLVETSYFNPPMGLYEILKEILNRGYKPLLAHPERYNYMDAKCYEHIQSMGIPMQLNILSLTGFYGKTVRHKAMDLMKKSTYSYVGSDLHNIGQIKLLKNVFTNNRFRTCLGGEDYDHRL